MTLRPIWCAWCNEQVFKETGAVNRARKAGLYLYCGRVCFGLGRRSPNPPSKEERVAAKAAYDAEYREKNKSALKVKKRAYFEKTYDPVKAAAHRKTRMPYHVEYCRKPEYRAKKREYDIKHRARQDFGEFAEAALALRDLEGEVAHRMSRYEIYAANGTLNKVLQRRRADGKANRSRAENSALGNPAGHQERQGSGEYR